MSSLVQWIAQKDEEYRKMEAAIGEERSVHEMEGRLARRDYKDKSDRPEF